MRQMITRLDDELHAQLKALAASEGRSVNDVVIDALRAVLGQPLTRSVVRERAKAAGWLVEFKESVTRPSLERLRAATAGARNALSEALEADRGEW
jgi:plasmid stability protein